MYNHRVVRFVKVVMIIADTLLMKPGFYMLNAESVTKEFLAGITSTQTVSKVSVCDASRQNVSASAAPLETRR